MHSLKNILRSVHDPFHISGGLQNLTRNLGTAVVKISQAAAGKRLIDAVASIFHSQIEVKKSLSIWSSRPK